MTKLWYHTQDIEGVWHGKCSTREEAIAEGRSDYDGEGFYVVWATNPPIQLGDWVEADRLLERASDVLSDSDRVCYEFDDNTPFICTPDQERDLEARIKQACNEWQAAHGLIFTVNTFENVGDREFIAAEIVDTPEAALTQPQGER